VKRQFTSFDHSQGNEQPPSEQAAMSQEWPYSPMNAQSNVPNRPAAQPPEGPPPQVPPRPAGSGLLSNWKSAQNQQVPQAQQPYPAPNVVAPSMPPRPQGPITDPTHNQQNVPSYMAAPVSPHQSGVNAIPAPFNGPNGANGQPYQPQQGPYIQNAPSFQPPLQNQGPQAYMAPPFTAQQPTNGSAGSPFNTPPAAFAGGQPRQPYQYPDAQPVPGQPNQPNTPFGLQPVVGQPQNPWQQGQIRPPGAIGPMNGGVPPGMNRTGGGGPGGSGGNNGKKSSRKKKRRFPIWARVVVGILTLLIILIGSGVYYYETNFAGAINNDIGQTAPRLKQDVNPNQNQDPSSSILSGNRVNILLLGSDDDYKSRVIYGGILAQTDIIVSIDPQSHSVTMFSLPRDTWLNVPGFGMHKLDQAFLLGGGGASGAALSMATIHQDFGVYIDHYAWVGLSGFTKVIDTVGGIDINVIHPITDDAYPDDTGKGATDPYAVKRLYIPPGPQHLNGLTALEYVRSRHADLVGDIGRSVRQQQILNQLKYKLDNPGIIGQLPTLASDLNGSIKTDMSLQQVFDLVNFARSVDQSKIQKITLGAPYSSDQQINTSSGIQDVIQLNCSLVQPLIAQTFGIGNNARCDLQADNNHSSSVAYATQPAPVANTTAQAALGGLWQAFSNMTQSSSMSLGGNWSDFLGIHELLDLMFLATFEEPAALLV